MSESAVRIHRNRRNPAHPNFQSTAALLPSEKYNCQFPSTFPSAPELHLRSFSEVEVGVRCLHLSDIEASIWKILEDLDLSVANDLLLLVSSPNRRRTCQIGFEWTWWVHTWEDQHCYGTVAISKTNNSYIASSLTTPVRGRIPINVLLIRSPPVRILTCGFTCLQTVWGIRRDCWPRGWPWPLHPSVLTQSLQASQA